MSTFDLSSDARRCYGINGVGENGLEKIVAVCTGWEGGTNGAQRPSGEQIANASLIAAAPELLAALKELARRFHVVTGGDEVARDAARAAIAKAEGRAQ